MLKPSPLTTKDTWVELCQIAPSRALFSGAQAGTFGEQHHHPVQPQSSRADGLDEVSLDRADAIIEGAPGARFQHLGLSIFFYELRTPSGRRTAGAPGATLARVPQLSPQRAGVLVMDPESLGPFRCLDELPRADIAARCFGNRQAFKKTAFARDRAALVSPPTSGNR